jgi:hypothetical protein
MAILSLDIEAHYEPLLRMCGHLFNGRSHPSQPVTVKACPQFDLCDHVCQHSISGRRSGRNISCHVTISFGSE